MGAATVVIVCLLSAARRASSFGFGRRRHATLSPPARPMPSTAKHASTVPKPPTFGVAADDYGADAAAGDNGGGGEHSKPGFVPPTFPKSEGDSALVRSALSANFMFQGLPDATLDRLVAAFERVECAGGSVIVAQGDTDIDYFYVLLEGECGVSIDGGTLPDPYGTLAGGGTVFGELSMLYDKPRAATVTAKRTGCVLCRVDRETFDFFLEGQRRTGEVEDVKSELREIDVAIDKIAGVKTRYSGSIIRPYRPQRGWLWRRWRGTVLEHAYKWALGNMAVTSVISLLVRRRPDCNWAIAMAPDQSHPLIRRMLAFSKHWHYLQGITTFILTFFLSQSYSLWRDTYSSARRIQGRLNDVGYLLATAAVRDADGRYTPEAESCLDDVGGYSRLFHAFLWANFAKSLSVLLGARGMSRMLSRGLMKRGEYDALRGIDPEAGASNACLEWMGIRALRGMDDGGLRDDESVKHVLLSKLSELRGVYAGIGDILDGRIPLAYTHIVQILVDSFLVTAPAALYAELGVWSILSVGILTLFYSGLLDLAKIFLDPLDNDDFCNDSVNMDIGVLIREGNRGSTRWKNGAAVLPF